MADLMDGLAPYFNHICYVVRDMDAAQSWFKRVMGVKHFGLMEAPMRPVMKRENERQALRLLDRLRARRHPRRPQHRIDRARSE